MDVHLLYLAYIVKLFRIFVLWFIMYLVEKVYLDRYLNSVFVEDKCPPSLMTYIVICMSVENIVFLLLLLVLFLTMMKFKGPTNSFFIDMKLLELLLVDYVISTIIIIGVGAAIARVVQDCSLFRYSHDGLRGIRAHAQILVPVSILVLMFPYYSLVGVHF